MSQDVDTKKENIRDAFSSSIKTLRGFKETQVSIDTGNEMSAVSEGCHLAAYNFDMYKSSKHSEEALQINLLDEACQYFADWKSGFIYADCQNFARTLMEMPSNHLTPEVFVQEVVNVYESHRLVSK